MEKLTIEQKNLTILNKHPEIHATYVFGSIAQCTEKSESDLDLGAQSIILLTK